MRLRILLTALAASACSLLVASAASAQSQRALSASGVGNAGVGGTEEEEPDKAQAYAARKPWQIGTSFETHRTLLQEDVGGRVKAFNYLSIFAGYNITQNNQIRVNGGVTQRFIADETETGLRADDINIGYTRRLQLPAQVGVGLNISNSLPISFQSQLMSLIALPRASVNVGRSFLDGTLSLSVRGGGAYYIVKYKTAEGQADANPRASTNVGFNVNYAIPFHQALQFGVNGSTSWSWSYDVDHANDPNLAQQFENRPVSPSADPYVKGQPAQQSYGGEVYVSYNLPSLVGVQTNIQVSVSQGDGVLRDGATHLYWLSRRGGQAYAALTVIY